MIWQSLHQDLLNKGSKFILSWSLSCSNMTIFLYKLLVWVYFNNLIHEQESELGHCTIKKLTMQLPFRCLESYFLKVFWKDWLSWCKIIKVIGSKFVSLSCNSQNRVFHPFLKTSLKWPTNQPTICLWKLEVSSFK